MSCIIRRMTDKESDGSSCLSRSIRAITLFVEDLQVAKRFYQEVFGLPVIFEDANSAVFEFGSTLVNLLKIEAAAPLVEPASVGDREAGARFQLTVEVDDVDAMCAELTARGRAAQRADGPPVGSPNRELHGPRGAHLGDRPIASSGKGNACPGSFRDEGGLVDVRSMNWTVTRAWCPRRWRPTLRLSALLRAVRSRSERSQSHRGRGRCTDRHGCCLPAASREPRRGLRWPENPLVDGKAARRARSDIRSGRSPSAGVRRAAEAVYPTHAATMTARRKTFAALSLPNNRPTVAD